jgi:hypothetical protein
MQGRMPGGAFFCLLFFAQTKKSKAPCKAQPVVDNSGKRRGPKHHHLRENQHLIANPLHLLIKTNQ